MYKEDFFSLKKPVRLDLNLKNRSYMTKSLNLFSTSFYHYNFTGSTICTKTFKNHKITIQYCGVGVGCFSRKWSDSNNVL